MHSLKGERTLMRVFIGESDRCAEGPYRGKPLHRWAHRVEGLEPADESGERIPHPPAG